VDRDNLEQIEERDDAWSESRWRKWWVEVAKIVG